MAALLSELPGTVLMIGRGIRTCAASMSPRKPTGNGSQTADAAVASSRLKTSFPVRINARRAAVLARPDRPALAGRGAL